MIIIVLVMVGSDVLAEGRQPEMLFPRFKVHTLTGRLLNFISLFLLVVPTFLKLHLCALHTELRLSLGYQNWHMRSFCQGKYYLLNG